MAFKIVDLISTSPATHTKNSINVNFSCKLQGQGWGCCPLLEAVCCDDSNCCPQGSRCNTTAAVCEWPHQIYVRTNNSFFFSTLIFYEIHVRKNVLHKNHLHSTINPEINIFVVFCIQLKLLLFKIIRVNI
jgi:hypothetical protein